MTDSSDSAAPHRWPWVALPGLALGAAFGAGLIVRDCSLTCNVGYRWAPLAWLAIALLAIPFVALQVKLLGKRPRFTAWQAGCALLAAGIFVGFRLWTEHVIDRNPYADPTKDPVFEIQAAYLTYYVFVDPLFVLLATNLVRLVRRVYGAAGTERAVGLMMASVLGGGLLGSGLASLGVPALLERGVRYEHARDAFLYVCALSMLVYAGLSWKISQRFPAEETGPSEPVLLRRAVKWVFTDRRLALTFALLVLTGMACITLDYLFYWLVTDGVDPADAGRTSWFAGFYMWLNAISLGLLLFGTGRLIQRLGLTFALVSLPIAFLAGGGALLVSATLLVACVVRIGKDGLLKTLFEPATECLMLREIDPARYDVLRTVLGGLGFSVGMGLAAGLLLALNLSLEQVPLQLVVGILLGIAALWCLAPLALREAQPVTGQSVE